MEGCAWRDVLGAATRNKELQRAREEIQRAREGMVHVNCASECGGGECLQPVKAADHAQIPNRQIAEDLGFSCQDVVVILKVK